MSPERIFIRINWLFLSCLEFIAICSGNSQTFFCFPGWCYSVLILSNPFSEAKRMNRNRNSLAKAAYSYDYRSFDCDLLISKNFVRWYKTQFACVVAERMPFLFNEFISFSFADAWIRQKSSLPPWTKLCFESLIFVEITLSFGWLQNKVIDAHIILSCKRQCHIILLQFITIDWIL